jgi:Nif-specific regulatory protein
MTFQKKLAATLRDKHIHGTKFSLDVRIIVTTSKDLSLLVQKGEFDRELYEQISKAFVYIEPLRRRIDDLEMLVDYFLKIECKKQGLLLKNFSPKLLEKMKKYDWPENIRELKICVERAVLYNPKAHIITDLELKDSASPLVDLSTSKRIFGDLPHVSDHSIALKERLAIVEREMILSEVKRHNGNKSKAAKSLGISREAIRKKLNYTSELLRSLNLSEDERAKLLKEDEEFNSAA